MTRGKTARPPRWTPAAAILLALLACIALGRLAGLFAFAPEARATPPAARSAGQP